MASPRENLGSSVSDSVFARLLLWLLLFTPLLLHFLALLVCLREKDGFITGLLDLFVLALVIAYSVGAGVALARHAFALRFLALTYSVLLVVAATELLLAIGNPLRHRHLVRAPTKFVTIAADTMPGISGPITFSVNSLGVRGPEMPLAKADFKILCVGGSAVECFHVTDEKSWPWLLGTRLSALLGKSVLVANAGKSGHIVLNHEYLLRNYDYADRFDWVVVMCGINDMGTLLLRRNYPERALAVPEETLGAPTIKGPYYRRLACLRSINRAYGPATVLQDKAGVMYAKLRAKRMEMLRQNTMTSLPSGLPEALGRYRADLERLIRCCQERHQKLLFLTQPTLYRTNLPPELASLICEHTDEGAYTAGVLEAIMAAINQQMLATCKEHGVECLDLAALVPKDTSTFYDDCHFNQPGCERVAEILVNYFQSRLAGATNAPVTARQPTPP